MFARKIIKGKTIVETWKRALTLIRETGSIIEITGGEKVKEVICLTTIIENPMKREMPRHLHEKMEEKFGERLPLLLDALTNPDVHPKVDFRSGELLWKWQSEVGAPSINQIDNLIKTLTQDPLTFRAVITPLNPLLDCENRLNPFYDMPIFGVIDFKFLVKNSTKMLSLLAHLRHCDVYLWWIVNAIQLSKLLDLIARRANSVTGAITMFSSSAYIHQNDFEEVDKLLKSLMSSKKESLT